MATSRWPVKDDQFNLFAHRSKSKTSVERAPSKQIYWGYTEGRMALWMPTYSIHFIVQSIPAMPRFFPLSPPPFSPIMFGLNKKSICFPFVYFEYTQALLCAYSRVWCTSSSYNAILEGRNHAFFVLLLSHCFAMKTSLSLVCINAAPFAYLFPFFSHHTRALRSDWKWWGILWCAKRLL